MQMDAGISNAPELCTKTCFKDLLHILVLLTTLGLIQTGQMAAQTFTTLYSFTGGTNGAEPAGGLIVSGNKTLYGTTAVGTLFKVNTDGTGFMNLHNVGQEAGSIILLGQTIYGTAAYGGGGGGNFPNGTVFKVNTDGTGFTNVHNFSGGHDGFFPYAGLIPCGNALYGAAAGGGNFGSGTLFKVNINGTGFANLYSFTAGSLDKATGSYTNRDGGYPSAGLILSGSTLYGTAEYGGSSGKGTVFAINTNGTGFTNLHSFSGVDNYSGDYFINSDGAHPEAPLILLNNTLYGTAAFGGRWGYGMVFAVNIDGTGFTNLHSFFNGGWPSGGLVLSGNTLYGTARFSGLGQGTVFAVKIDGTGFRNLHSFNGLSDGGLPYGGTILSGNVLYGTAKSGGKFSPTPGNSGNGTVFSLSLGPRLPTVNCSPALVLECENGSAKATVHAEVEDTNGNPLQVVWTVDVTPSQTNSIPSGGNLTASNVTFTANFELGDHLVVVSASNGQSDPVTCSTVVTVHDTTPPQILNIAATPNVLWPPNHRMVPIKLTVEAVDNCDPSPTVKIINVTSSEPQTPFAPDWEITGPTSLNLRAERSGKGQGRIYTIGVQCKDVSGNISTATVRVNVPHD